VTVTNTLAYFGTQFVTAVKRFLVLALALNFKGFMKIENFSIFSQLLEQVIGVCQIF
jgi:hypothetical protein